MNLSNFCKRLYFINRNQTNKLYQFTTQICFQSGCKYYKLETPLFKKILSNDLIYLSGLFKKHNFELRIAGGAVRDLLMEIEPNDVDLATDAMPNQMLDLFQREQIRIFNLKGLKHGTVAIRINDKVIFTTSKLKPNKQLIKK